MREISLQAVSRVFGRTFALHRVDMTLEAGTMTLLLGDNGSGKTTLLNILATLDSPTEGEVRYDSVDWTEFSRRHREKVGWITHESLLYDELTGRENLRFYARMYNLDDVAATISSWLDRVGLSDAADQLVNTYSRGMKQRLTVARALLHDPALLLLDEPLTGLDRSGRRRVADLLDDLRDRHKIIVVTTHDLKTLGDVADQIGILRRGKLTHFGDLESADAITDLYREYA